MAVRTAIGVRKAKPCRSAADDVELTLVHGAVMGSADYDEVISVVLAALRAQLDVMQVDEGRVFAPGDDAAALVAAEDVTAKRRRYGLRGVLGGMRVAASHVGRLR